MKNDVLLYEQNQYVMQKKIKLKEEARLREAVSR